MKEKEIKGIQLEESKEEIQVIICTHDCLCGKYQSIYKKVRVLLSKLSKVTGTGHKVNIQKYITFLYSSNVQLDIEI